MIAAPWAKDANGKNIPTSYEISGTMLTQKVDHAQGDDVTYPVVADPDVHWEWWGVAVKMSRGETLELNRLVGHHASLVAAF